MKSNNTSKIRSKKMMKGGLHEQVKKNIIYVFKEQIPPFYFFVYHKST